MATTFLTQSTNSFVTVFAGDELVVMPGVSITSTTTGVLTGIGTEPSYVSNLGTIVATNDVIGALDTVYVSNSGHMQALRGAAFNFAGNGVDLQVVNHGTIQASGNIARASSTTTNGFVSLINHGTIAQDTDSAAFSRGCGRSGHGYCREHGHDLRW